ncbi:MAG: 16S rRNA (cytidine(1402)-2'-O)-methyltransferase [Pseudomonadota bacterium]
MTHTGTLYIVATPIGNLEDITLRAIRILKEVGLIAAEDTRHTRKLLNAFDVQTSLVSLHEHNEGKRSLSLILKMKEGLSVAYVSDAGTPGLSDPGFRLIRAALAHEISVVPIPGVSAVITALSVSGLSMSRFLFQGFLPAKTARRRQQLAELAMETGTLVFFESPNRLLSALHDISDIMGNRDVVVCRELTKIYESFFRGSVQETIRTLEGQRIKGEITLLVSGCPEAKPEWSDTALMQRFEQLRQNPALSRRDCVDRIAAETGIPKSRVYRLTVTA